MNEPSRVLDDLVGASFLSSEPHKILTGTPQSAGVTVYRHVHNTCNIRIAIKMPNCKQYHIKVSKSDLIKAHRACKV